MKMLLVGLLILGCASASAAEYNQGQSESSWSCAGSCVVYKSGYVNRQYSQFVSSSAKTASAALLNMKKDCERFRQDLVSIVGKMDPYALVSNNVKIYGHIRDLYNETEYFPSVNRDCTKD